MICLFEASKLVTQQSYWSSKWNVDKNWQNQEKPEYVLLILV